MNNHAVFSTTDFTSKAADLTWHATFASEEEALDYAYLKLRSVDKNTSDLAIYIRETTSYPNGNTLILWRYVWRSHTMNVEQHNKAAMLDNYFRQQFTVIE